MTNRFRFPSAITNRLEELGISPTLVLQHAGLPVGLFREAKVVITTEEMFAIYRAIAKVSTDPAIGLKLGTAERTERYDPIAIAALCTRTFRDALQRMARYKQLTCPEKIELTEQGDECGVHFVWLLAHETEPALLVDLCFAWIAGIGSRGVGRTLRPKRVEFQRPAANREIYEAHFHCPVKFRAAENLLVFHREDLDERFVTHNAELLAMVAPQLESELKEQSAEKTFREQTKSVLKRLLAGQRPGLGDVARELRISTRTLQRRLTREGLSFQLLLQEARRELAQHYLLNSSLELNETAYLLGYADANSFFRAFHHWEGKSPGEWRASRLVPA